MATEIKVNRKDLINKLAGLKDDNIGIAGIAIDRSKLLQALKLQTQDGADVMTIRYGNVSWIDQYKHNEYGTGYWKTETIENEPCIEVSCNHTTMRFLNRPKAKYNNEPQIKHLSFVSELQPQGNLSGIRLDTRELLNALTFVSPCMAADDTRPILHAVLFDSGNDTLKLVTADGFRLATNSIKALGIPEYKYVINNYNGEITKLTAYLKAIKPIGKGKSRSYPEVYLSFGENSITFKSVNGILELPKFDGTFPDYTQLIPKAGTEIQFIASSMLQAVKALSAVAKDGSGIIKLVFQQWDTSSKITLSAHNEEFGDTQVECDAIVESDCKIAVNHKYLVDLLKLCGDFKVTALITTPSSPMVFNAENWQCVIMPMFVQWGDAKPAPKVEVTEPEDESIDGDIEVDNSYDTVEPNED